MSEQPYSPVIIAHRGLHSDHPENSLAAFRAAWDAGFTWCECDVWDSSVDEIIIIHDDTLDRTTTGLGSVQALKVDDARDGLRLRMPDGRVTDQPLPSLGDVLDICREDEQLLVEIKPPNNLNLVHHTLEVMNGHGAIQSFALTNINHAFAHDAVSPTAWLVGSEADLQQAGRCRCRGIHVLHSLLTVETVEFLRHHNKHIGAWTVNEPADIERMLDLRIDVIISDQPLLVRRMIEQRDNAR